MNFAHLATAMALVMFVQTAVTAQMPSRPAQPEYRSPTIPRSASTPIARPRNESIPENTSRYYDGVAQTFRNHGYQVERIPNGVKASGSLSVSHSSSDPNDPGFAAVEDAAAAHENDFVRMTDEMDAIRILNGIPEACGRSWRESYNEAKARWSMPAMKNWRNFIPPPLDKGEAEKRAKKFSDLTEAAINEALRGVDPEKNPELADKLIVEAMVRNFRQNYKLLPGTEHVEKILNASGQSLGDAFSPASSEPVLTSKTWLEPSGAKATTTSYSSVAVTSGPEEMIAMQMEEIENLRRNGQDATANSLLSLLRFTTRHKAATVAAYERRGLDPPQLDVRLLHAAEELLGEKMIPTEAEIKSVKIKPAGKPW